MNEFLNKQIIILIKQRCNELLQESQNKDLDFNSFTIGYLYAITDQINAKMQSINVEEKEGVI
jgi:hypothetical protein